MELVFASSNQNKIKEIDSVLNQYGIFVKSLNDIGCIEDIPETGKTFHDNALLKARFVYDTYNSNCFADDSGLEVETLNNEPGVYSARYAGEPKNDSKNIEKLLKNLEGKSNRNACFKTVIALIIDGNEQFFDGVIKGQITQNPIGSSGFGYDPVFIPDGYDKTFAQMSLDEKNLISHRSLAIQKLAQFLASKA